MRSPSSGKLIKSPFRRPTVHDGVQIHVTDAVPDFSDVVGFIGSSRGAGRERCAFERLEERAWQREKDSFG